MLIGDEFLIACKKNYFDKVTPANKESRQKEGYKKLVNIANEFFESNEYEKFAGFLQEGQYFVQLWAAHLIIEYGQSNQELILSALIVIKNYSENPMAEDVAREERQWLVENNHKFGSMLG